MKAYYQHKPQAIEAVGNGSILYRMNITEETKHDQFGNENVQFVCDEFVVWKLSKDEIIRTVIVELYGNGLEEKLINDFNAATAGILPEDAKNPYLNYLAQRIIIKEKIKSDCEQAGVM